MRQFTAWVVDEKKVCVAEWSRAGRWERWYEFRDAEKAKRFAREVELERDWPEVERLAHVYGAEVI